MLYLAGLTSPSAVALTCTGGAGSPQAQDPARERQKEKEQEPRSDGALTRHLPSWEAPALEEARRVVFGCTAMCQQEGRNRLGRTADSQGFPKGTQLMNSTPSNGNPRVDFPTSGRLQDGKV